MKLKQTKTISSLCEIPLKPARNFFIFSARLHFSPKLNNFLLVTLFNSPNSCLLFNSALSSQRHLKAFHIITHIEVQGMPICSWRQHTIKQQPLQQEQQVFGQQLLRTWKINWSLFIWWSKIKINQYLHESDLCKNPNQCTSLTFLKSWPSNSYFACTVKVILVK